MPTRLISKVIAGGKIVTTDKTTTVREAAQIMAREKVGAIIILAQQQLAGIFTERDVLYRVVARGLDPDRTQLAQVMTDRVMTIAPHRPLGHALHMMHESGFRHLPVVDHGRVIGMVSARDALGSELIEFETELKRRDEIAETMR